MREIIKTNTGEREIDPHGRKHSVERILKSVGYFENKINYLAFSQLNATGSELAIKFLIDMLHGKNIAKGTSRGPRSYNHLFNIMHRVPFLIEQTEKFAKKPFLELTDDDIIRFFASMRNGVIRTKGGNPYRSVGTYCKIFSAFWRWVMRTRPELNLRNIVEHLDTRDDEKPKWEHFTLKDVELMTDLTSSLYYKAILFFLFDSGIRAPKELMNVRVKDITPVPDSNYLFLQIRNETSKTFGRKIKLMICSDMLKKYLQTSGLQADDFIFHKTYAVMSRMVAQLGYKALKRGTPSRQKTNKLLIKQGITMYDFRHNSVCHYLPIYRSENQMKYRYGWSNSDMIQYYSEYIGMRDTISDDDMITDSSKPQLILELEREKQKFLLFEERMRAKEQEMEDRMKKMEVMMLQKFADNF